MSYYNPLLEFKFVLLTKIKKMKKLIFILLFLPLMSFGQDMTYEDLMGFENTKQVERFLIERNYEKFDKEDKKNINYGYNIDYRDDGTYINKGARISIDNDSLSFKNAFNLGFYVDFMFTSEEDYNRIYDVAKKELEFLDVFSGIALYNIEESGVILGFSITENNHYVTLMRVKEDQKKTP